MALLDQTQAKYFLQAAETDRLNSECFARIETLMAEITRTLHEQTRMLREISRRLIVIKELIEQLPSSISAPRSSP